MYFWRKWFNHAVVCRVPICCILRTLRHIRAPLRAAEHAWLLMPYANMSIKLEMASPPRRLPGVRNVWVAALQESGGNFYVTRMQKSQWNSQRGKMWNISNTHVKEFKLRETWATYELRLMKDRSPNNKYETTISCILGELQLLMHIFMPIRIKRILEICFG